MADIAFLGIGNMGRGMAGRLLAAGHKIRVYNRTPAKAQALAEAGAAIAATPREAAREADAVFAMVGDDPASQAVWLGDDGALAADLAPGTFVVECSTLSHDWVLSLADHAAARDLRYVDCPVTGLPDAAAAGTLTLFVGAPAEDLNDVRPLLAPLCEEIIHFGPVGAGTAYKLMINLMGSVQIAAIGEGMLIAEKAGLDADLVAYAVARGAAASPQVIRNSRRMADADHDRNIVFSGRWRLKDTDYGMRLAAKVGQPARFGGIALSALQRLVDAGDGDLNESKVIEALRDETG